jgi:hypothetical protein
MRKTFVVISFLLVLWIALAAGQDDSPITVLWPSNDKPSLKLTFGKFQQSGMVNGQWIFVSDVTAQNVSDQGMPRSVFTVFLSDKNGVRIGRARLQFSEIGPYLTQKAQIQFSATGTPAGVTLLAGKAIPLRVISVPVGANFKVDGQDAGVTPKVVDFTIGSHTLEFSKEGYATGTTPLEVGADELPGGSVSFELGGLSQDTLELRDGTTVLGDVISMSLTAVVVRVEGKDQKYERNQVKKMILVERITTQQSPITQPAPAKPK